jgi:hypothetical protein
MTPRWIANTVARLALATVASLAPSAALATTGPPAGYVDASMFGYDSTDATTALQAALDTGSNVFVPKEASPWYVAPIMLTHSNQRILFESGSVVAAKSGAFAGIDDSLFTAQQCSNVSMIGYGATLTMQKSDYTSPPYSESQWRHGISLLGVTGFTVEGLKITNTGGDGIYLGDPTQSAYCQDVTIKNVAIDNVYRNGISVISVKNLLVDNAVITNTNGHAPQAGIDIEPNFPDTERIDNVTIRNSIINANGGNGVLLAMWKPQASGTLENLTIVSNRAAGVEMLSPQPGLTIKDLLIASNSDVGLRSCSTTDGEASGLAPNAIAYSDLWGNSGGSTSGWVTRGAGVLTRTQPHFFSTDVSSPYYMYLDLSTSSLILHGASDGGYMGARGLVPEPGALALLATGSLSGLAYLWNTRNNA